MSRLPISLFLGLDINDELEYGWTPLLLAATVANEKIISELLKRGADVNQTRDDSTALMLTCNIAAEDEDMKSNVLACCKLLLDNGIDPNTINRKRRTALMSAAYNGHLEVVKLLLPLTNKDAEDNQRWNALFWAAEGNKTEIVDLLLKEGFSCDKIDVRGNTIADVARSNGFENILKLLPKDPFNDEFYVCLNNNHVNFEEVFNNLKRQEKPQLFVDICKILYGTRSENMVSVLRDKDIDLLEFLSCSDSKLKEMGIQLPYQRNRILGGLFKFHKHPFQPKSIPFVRKGELYTNIDVSSAVLSCVRQLIAMEASLKFIMENHEVPLSPQESREIQASLAKNRSQIHRLKIVSEVFVKKTEKVLILFMGFNLETRRQDHEETVEYTLVQFMFFFRRYFSSNYFV
ncbi:ankyrin repeat, SAM and basic leucine zipper domain-containing protein 1 [Asbolus verrucosus]|uniref:Ankyrin repeat, SAM and basic leucine zipper domain-containing protein 1 n=1 Tax=Asbolus verrucosus TaxID=1661398 RepID=A0A482WBN5_ASBVE|nr:ankyrin repeat, SAM and basic leucine zipper domain-containing protein 1 [Asbolus verrucosus]